MSILESLGDVLPVTATGGSASRLLADKLGERISVKDFGAVGDGVADDSAAIQAAIDASAVVVDAETNYNTVTNKVFLSPGVYKIDTPLVLKSGVSISGASLSTVRFKVSSGSPLFVTTPSTDYAAIRLSDFTIEGDGATDFFDGVEGLIRSCIIERVHFFNHKRALDLTDVWTLVIRDCSSFTGTDSVIYCGAGCGAIRIEGGRYDVCDEFHVTMDAAAGELLITDDASFQFGDKGGVRVLDAYTVLIDTAFFEGNCIGNPSHYYIEVTGGGGALSSCTIRNTAINNLSDSNRDGLGAISASGFESFTYEERWVRNGVAEIPVVGSDVKRTSLKLNNSAVVSLPSIAFDATRTATIEQLDRPSRFYGIDMNGGPSVALTTRAAMNVGLPTIGVAIGTYDQRGALQAYGASNILNINPNAGRVVLPAVQSRATATSGNTAPTDTNPRVVALATSTTQNISLDELDPNDFIEYSVIKTADGSTINIVPNASHSVNGGSAGAQLVISGAGSAGLYTIIGCGTAGWRVCHAD